MVFILCRQKILIKSDGKIIGRYSEEAGPLDAELKQIFGNQIMK